MRNARPAPAEGTSLLELTPAERRGALVLLALFALGTAWDLLHGRPVPAPPPPAEPPAAAGLPAEGQAAPAEAASGVPALDLNAASAEELDALPGIGPVLARRIVEQRRQSGPFRSVEELRSVRGIGPKLFVRLRPLVRAGGDSARAIVHAARSAPR